MLPSKEDPLPPIMVSSNIAATEGSAAATFTSTTTTARPTTPKARDFIDLAFL